MPLVLCPARWELGSSVHGERHEVSSERGSLVPEGHTLGFWVTDSTWK